MNMLLVAINAKYIHSNLAVYSLKKAAAYYGDKVSLAEYTINNQMEWVVMDIYKRKPDVLLFSCYVWNIEYVVDAARLLHKIMPKMPIWVGGPEVSYDGVDIFKKYDFLKGVMIGEGEKSFESLCKYYIEKEGSLSDIDGIMYRASDAKDSEIITTPKRILTNLDDVEFVYDDLRLFENKIIYYESSRGCPFRCSYCMSSIDKSVRFRSLDKVFEELKYFLDNKVLQVKFIDRTFNINADRTIKILEFLEANDNGITNFHFEIAADIVTDEEIAILNRLRAGYVQLEIGVQSTNTKTIEEIDRKMDFERVREVSKKLIKGSNIHIHLDLIAGLPHEDIESFKKSFNDVYSIHPNELQLGFLKVLKGSKMHEKASEYGIVYNDKAPYEVCATKWISFDDIIFLKEVEEILEVYYNSGLFVHTMIYLENYFDSPFDIYKELSVYYKDKGVFGINHTRISRYQMLREFAAQLGDTYLDEIIILDLYLKEKLKTRPYFAKEEDRELLKRLNRKYAPKNSGKNIHIEIFDFDVINFMQSGMIEKRRCIICFDYDEKNAVTGYANVKEIGETDD